MRLSWRPLGATLLAFWVLNVTNGCHTEFEGKKLRPVRDNLCSRVLACSRTNDCTPGLICDALPESEDPERWPDADGDSPGCVPPSDGPLERVCQLPRGRSGRDVLLSGFRVSAFELRRADDVNGAAALRWDPVPGAKLVHCALFACEPYVRETGRYGAYPTFEIANPDRCVLAHDILSADGGLFDLGNRELALSSDDWRGFPAALYAGCWAFNDVRIVAATSLEPVLLGEVSNYRNVRDDTCTAEGRPCARSDGSTGVCGPDQDASGERCRMPCLSASDCVVSLFTRTEERASLDAGPETDGGGYRASGPDATPQEATPYAERCVWPASQLVGYCDTEQPQ